MTIFTIKESIPCYVNFIYRVEAENAEEATENFLEAEADFVREEVGETIGWLDHTGLEVTEGEPSRNNAEAA